MKKRHGAAGTRDTTSPRARAPTSSTRSGCARGPYACRRIRPHEATPAMPSRTPGIATWTHIPPIYPTQRHNPHRNRDCGHFLRNTPPPLCRIKKNPQTRMNPAMCWMCRIETRNRGRGSLISGLLASIRSGNSMKRGCCDRVVRATDPTATGEPPCSPSLPLRGLRPEGPGHRSAVPALRCRRGGWGRDPVLSGLSLNFPDELVRAIATETARLVKEDGLAFSPWLNVDEAAAYLSIPVGRLRNLTAAKQIKFSPQGKSYIYNREWLDEYARRAADGH